MQTETLGKRRESCLQELLEVCGRSHSLYDVYTAIEAMHAAGPRSWSLDLMSG